MRYICAVLCMRWTVGSYSACLAQHSRAERVCLNNCLTVPGTYITCAFNTEKKE